MRKQKRNTQTSKADIQCNRSVHSFCFGLPEKRLQLESLDLKSGSAKSCRAVVSQSPYRIELRSNSVQKNQYDHSASMMKQQRARTKIYSLVQVGGWRSSSEERGTGWVEVGWVWPGKRKQKRLR